MSIKRYDKDYYRCACGGCIIEPNEYGDYVLYSDYLKEVEKLRADAEKYNMLRTGEFTISGKDLAEEIEIQYLDRNHYED